MKSLSMFARRFSNNHPQTLSQQQEQQEPQQQEQQQPQARQQPQQAEQQQQQLEQHPSQQQQQHPQQQQHTTEQHPQPHPQPQPQLQAQPQVQTQPQPQPQAQQQKQQQWRRRQQRQQQRQLIKQRELIADDEEDLFPPDNFSMVDAGIYRSSFPMKKHFPFLRKLGLRTILTLVVEELPPANLDFVQAHGIRLVQIGVEGNKEPFKYIPLEEVRFAVREMADSKNHPMLVHCNKGKHRTGCLIGCFRKWQGWGLSSIFEEYARFASPKARLVDQRYIELFQLEDKEKDRAKAEGKIKKRPPAVYDSAESLLAR
ncbi:unnamed protein product [Ascophyllum nodosum]